MDTLLHLRALARKTGSMATIPRVMGLCAGACQKFYPNGETVSITVCSYENCAVYIKRLETSYRNKLLRQKIFNDATWIKNRVILTTLKKRSDKVEI